MPSDKEQKKRDIPIKVHRQDRMNLVLPRVKHLYENVFRFNMNDHLLFVFLPNIGETSDLQSMVQNFSEGQENNVTTEQEAQQAVLATSGAKYFVVVDAARAGETEKIIDQVPSARGMKTIEKTIFFIDPAQFAEIVDDLKELAELTPWAQSYIVLSIFAEKFPQVKNFVFSLLASPGFTDHELLGE